MTEKVRKSRAKVRPQFVFNGVPYMRVTPSKSLFHSTTIHEVVNRGDFFAVNMATGELTVLKGGSDAVKA